MDLSKWNEARKIFSLDKVLMATFYAEKSIENCAYQTGLDIWERIEVDGNGIASKCHYKSEINCLKWFSPYFSGWAKVCRLKYTQRLHINSIHGHRIACKPFEVFFRFKWRWKCQTKMQFYVDNPSFDLSFDVMGKWMFKVAARKNTNANANAEVWKEYFLMRLM